MRCPVDNETLVMTERNGVEIDYCPKCRGVWLDRGELDKIIERASVSALPPVIKAEPAPVAAPVPHPQAAPQQHDARSRDRGRDRRRDDDDDDDDDDRYRKRRKRESFLGDLFDF